MNQSDLVANIESHLHVIEMAIEHIRSTLAELIDVAPAPDCLNIPWIGQNTVLPTDDYSNSDCGAACLAMLVNWFGKVVTVDDVSRMTGKARGYSSLGIQDMINTAAKFGMSLKSVSGLTADGIRAELDACRPVIVLFNYRSLPSRFDKNYNAGHWCIIVGHDPGGFIYHDPYWLEAVFGSNLTISEADFTRAFTAVAPGNTLAQHALVLR